MAKKNVGAGADRKPPAGGSQQETRLARILGEALMLSWKKRAFGGA